MIEDGHNRLLTHGGLNLPSDWVEEYLSSIRRRIDELLPHSGFGLFKWPDSFRESRGSSSGQSHQLTLQRVAFMPGLKLDPVALLGQWPYWDAPNSHVSDCLCITTFNPCGHGVEEGQQG